MAKRLDEATKKRLRAGRMLLAGKRPAEVAEKVGVARQTVYTWKDLLDEGGLMRCAQSHPEADQPNWMHHSLKGYTARCCKSRPNTVLALSSGHSSELAQSSSVCTVSSLAQHSFGEFLCPWVSAYKSLRSARWNAVKIPFASGRRTWPTLKKSPAGRQSDCL